MGINKEVLLDMYENMYKIRRFEETIEDLQKSGELRGSAHLCIGQEAVATGVCFALSKKDYIISNHRGHGHCIAKGARLDKMMAELYGKSTGYCKGKGGSMHIADLSMGNLGANGIVGGGIPIAVGAGLAIKLRHLHLVVACFFGDGANNQGSFHESLNFASIKKLPVIFVCENNQYGVSLNVKKSTAVANVSDRAKAYNILGKTIDGNDVIEVYETVRKVVSLTRNKNGPFLIECKTYRWRGHSIADPRAYRTREEEEEWKRKCPIKRLERKLTEQMGVDELVLENIRDKVEKILIKAVEYARTSPFPDEKDILENVYSL